MIEFINEHFNVLVLCILLIGLAMFIVFECAMIDKINNIRNRLNEVESRFRAVKYNIDDIRYKDISNLKIEVDSIYDNMLKMNRMLRKLTKKKKAKNVNSPKKKAKTDDKQERKKNGKESLQKCIITGFAQSNAQGK